MFRRNTAQDLARQHASLFSRDCSVPPDKRFAARVKATWDLIHCGEKAVPVVLEMLNSPSADIREDAAGILAEIGKDANVAEALLGRLESETDQQARDTLIQALGALRAKSAIPKLIEIIEDADADGDTRFCAMESLGKIVRRRFLDRDDPEIAVKDWIARHHQRI